MKLWFSREQRDAFKRDFLKFWERNGFALVLLLCAGVIGVTAVLTSQEADPSPAEAIATPTPPPMALQTPDISPYEAVTAQTPPPVELLAHPLLGAPGLPYAWDELVYNQTLGEWRVHEGIDILAPEGAEVRAARDGRVTLAYWDDSWGNVVVIAHEGGLISGYASLGEILVSRDEQVRQGQVIGTAGTSAPIEAAEGPHLHFYLYRGEEPVNPMDLLP